MPRFGPRPSGSPALRAVMLGQLEERRIRFRTEDRAHLDDMFDVMAQRWRSGDPVEVHGWELPDEYRGDFGPSDRVVVCGDGTLVRADRYDGATDLRAV